MVVDRVTDGGRIAQLLASELSGREEGPLARLSVVDADRDAEPSAEGTTAYGIAVDGHQVGDVLLYPDSAELHLDATPTSPKDADSSSLLDVGAVVESVRSPGLAAELTGDRGAVVTIQFGAAVKRAVDALVAGLD
jgi:hypothetical protein